MIRTVDDIAALLRGFRFRFQNERELQDGIESVLTRAGAVHAREVDLGVGDRIDFVVEPAIGIEVKIDGSTAEVTRQPAGAGRWGVTTPWQVRYSRWWSRREAQRHRDVIADKRLDDGGRVCSHAGVDDHAPCPHLEWHREQASEYDRVADERRAWWLRTGKVDLVLVDEKTAKGRMAGYLPYYEATTLVRGRYVWSRPSWV